MWRRSVSGAFVFKLITVPTPHEYLYSSVTGGSRPKVVAWDHKFGHVRVMARSNKAAYGKAAAGQREHRRSRRRCGDRGHDCQRAGAAETRKIPALPAQRGGEPGLAGAVAGLCAALRHRRSGMAGAGDARPVRRHDRQGHRRAHPYAQDQSFARRRAHGRAQASGAARQPRRHARILSLAHRGGTDNVRGSGAARARLCQKAHGNPDASRPRSVQSRAQAAHRAFRGTGRRVGE